MIKVRAGSEAFEDKDSFLSRITNNSRALKLLHHQNHYSEIKKEIAEAGNLYKLNLDPSPIILSIPDEPNKRLLNDFINLLTVLGIANIVLIIGTSIIYFAKEFE